MLRIICVGNPIMGSDSVGIYAYELLKNRHLQGVELINAMTGGLDILAFLESAKKVIVIDAVQAGRKRGDIIEFDSSRIDSYGVTKMASLHDLGLDYTIRLAQKLLPKMPNIRFYGIEIGKDVEAGLDKSLKDAAKEAVDLIIETEKLKETVK